MRVLLLNSFYPPEGIGGSEQSVRILADSLNKFTPVVADVASISEGGSEFEDIQDGVRTFRFGGMNVLLNTRAAESYVNDAMVSIRRSKRNTLRPRLHELVKTNKYDIVHFNTFPDLFGLTNFLKKSFPALKLVWTPRSYSTFCSYRMFKHDTKCESLCVSCRPSKNAVEMSKKFDALLPISSQVASRLLWAGLATNVGIKKVIPNAVDLVEIVPQDSQSSFLKNTTVPLVYVGRIHPTKGVEHVLQLGSKIGVHVVVVGDGNPNYVADLQRRFPEAEFLGFRFDLREIYESPGVICVNSLWPEPFGRIPIEAASFGRTVVITKEVGCSEFLHGINSVFVAGDEGLNEKLIHTAMNSEIETEPHMRFHHQQEVLKRFAGERVAGEVFKSYLELFEIDSVE